jgi:hypothetical protein
MNTWPPGPHPCLHGGTLSIPIKNLDRPTVSGSTPISKRDPQALAVYCRPVLPKGIVGKLPTTLDPTILRHSIPLL